MAKDTSFLRFTKRPQQSALTGIWAVHSVAGADLGVVGWFNSWRRYVFFPHQATVFDTTCLLELSVFLERRTDEQKADAAKRLAERKKTGAAKR